MKAEILHTYKSGAEITNTETKTRFTIPHGFALRGKLRHCPTDGR